MVELVSEVALRAELYRMERDMGMEAARATERYRRLDKQLADLEAKHIAEVMPLLDLLRIP